MKQNQLGLNLKTKYQNTIIYNYMINAMYFLIGLICGWQFIPQPQWAKDTINNIIGWVKARLGMK